MWRLSLLTSFILYSALNYSQGSSTVVNNSHIAFTVPEKDLLPESIAYDPVNNTIYMGSTRIGKILTLSADGNSTDFIGPGQDGLWMVIGIKADVQRRLLWVCSSGGDNLIGYHLKDDREGRPAGIFKFNLDTGKLIKKYVLDQKGEVHFFNDLVIAKNGDLYATHMFKDHAVYKISREKDLLEKYHDSEFIKYPNGLTLSDDDSKLYVAHSKGIALIDLEKNKALALGHPEELEVSGRASIDGLYFYGNSLIGVQADTNTVQRFFLNSEGTEIMSS